MVFLKEFFEYVNFEDNQQMTRKTCKITQHSECYIWSIKPQSPGFEERLCCGTAASLVIFYTTKILKAYAALVIKCQKSFFYWSLNPFEYNIHMIVV